MRSWPRKYVVPRIRRGRTNRDRVSGLLLLLEVGVSNGAQKADGGNSPQCVPRMKDYTVTNNNSEKHFSISVFPVPT